MAKFFGKIGYVENVETSPGVFRPVATEKDYTGDLLRNVRDLTNPDKVNDDIKIANEIHIVADAYADEHFYAIRYATIRGIKWKVTKVEVRHPRLILTLGGLYNGTSARASAISR